MGLSDCEKCWDTPCSCGYQFLAPNRPHSTSVALFAAAVVMDPEGETNVLARMFMLMQTEAEIAQRDRRETMARNWHGFSTHAAMRFVRDVEKAVAALKQNWDSEKKQRVP